MITSLRHSIVVIIAVALTAGTQAQQDHVAATAEVKASAAAQLAYARKLASETVAVPGDAHMQAVLMAVTAFEAVPSHWPSDASAICTAREGQAALFLREQIFANAVRTADLALADGCRQAPALNRIKGLALERLGRFSEAEDALKSARHGSGFGSLSGPEKLAIDNALAYFYEKTGDTHNAVTYLREAAKYADRLTAVAMLIRSADLNERSHDLAAERDDLAALDDALAQARSAHLDPGEIVALKQFENNVAQKHKKSGG